MFLAVPIRFENFYRQFQGLAERKLTMLHQFITACREHDGAHTVEGLRFVKSKQTHLGQQGMSGR